MNLYFIERYIQKLKKEDIYKYATNQGINIKPNDLDTIYSYLLTNYKVFLTNKDTRPKIIAELKKQVSLPIATKIDELYNQYKDKI